jgi:osmotically-inducible protein OsmY
MSADAQVLHDVIAALDEVPGLRASRLFIDVRKRVVTIRGRVPGDAERNSAERAARRIVGPRALVLELSIVPSASVGPKK